MEAHISETVSARDFWLVSMAPADKMLFYRLSSKVRKCLFSHKGALTKVKGHFLAVFQWGVNFGSSYLRNRLSYRVLVGLNGSRLKNTFFLGYLPRLKNVILALVVLY